MTTRAACGHDEAAIVNLCLAFGHFSQRGLPTGAIETSCDRCKETTVTGLPDKNLLADAAVWARDHRCPPPVTRASVLETMDV